MVIYCSLFRIANQMAPWSKISNFDVKNAPEQYPGGHSELMDY